ncbi:hypothetical protein FB451DRAFT_1361470 [Mycena latifolia]|nr:hypothetical protein FB451DRAFT_1361470 [Mycena latifolia]
MYSLCCIHRTLPAVRMAPIPQQGLRTALHAHYHVSDVNFCHQACRSVCYSRCLCPADCEIGGGRPVAVVDLSDLQPDRVCSKHYFDHKQCIYRWPLNLPVLRCMRTKFYVMILPITMMTATTVVGYILAYQQLANHTIKIIPSTIIGFVLSVATNGMLTILTAGRIWWLGREVRMALQESVRFRYYNTAVAMILESGAIYSLCVLTFLLSTFGKFQAAIVVSNILYSAMSQIVASILLLAENFSVEWTRPEYCTNSDPGASWPQRQARIRGRIFRRRTFFCVLRAPSCG